MAIDEEHVHVGNEVDKLLIQGRKDGGVTGILKVHSALVMLFRKLRGRFRVGFLTQ